MSRAVIAAVLAALLVPVTVAAPAEAKRKKHCKVVKVHGHKKKKCKKRKKKAAVTKIPVTATVLDGSQATLDFGDGNLRTIGLTGAIHGYVPGKIRLGSDVPVVLTDGSLAVPPTDILTDSCAAPAIARTNPATAIMIDPSKPSTGKLSADGTVVADANVIIRAVLDLRQPDGCGLPAVTSGYSDSPAFVHLGGKVGDGGLTSLSLNSDPYALPLNGCMTPGDPLAPCAAAPTVYPTTTTVALKVLLDLSGQPSSR